MATYAHFELVPPNAVAWDNTISIVLHLSTASTITVQEHYDPQDADQGTRVLCHHQGNLVGGLKFAAPNENSANGTNDLQSITGLARTRTSRRRASIRSTTS